MLSRIVFIISPLLKFFFFRKIALLYIYSIYTLYIYSKHSKSIHLKHSYVLAQAFVKRNMGQKKAMHS